MLAYLKVRIESFIFFVFYFFSDLCYKLHYFVGYRIYLGVQKKKRWKAKLVVFLLLAIGIAVGFFCYVESVVDPILKEACTASVNALAVDAMNNAAAVASEKEYTDFFTLETNGDTEVLKANSNLINNLTRQVSTVAQNELNKLTEEKLSIPIGTLTGVAIFTGKGHGVDFEIMPIGAANCEFVSEFTEAGINQTKHSLYLVVSCDIKIVAPLKDMTATATSQILLCENIIVGDVPTTYFQILDLLP